MDARLLDQLEAVVEKLNHPGVLGVRGHKIELRCQREVAAYFRQVAADLENLNLEHIAETDVKDRAMVRHAVEMSLSNILRRHRPTLLMVLASNLMDGITVAWEHDYGKQLLKEADPIDKLGLTAQRAADLAAQQAAQQIVGIDETTIDQISEAIMSGIEEQLGVDGTARAIKAVVDGMTTTRARMIASTEMNTAMSDAALEKMQSIGIEYKQLILSPGACEICEDNHDEDPIPVDDDYPSGDDSPPFHPNCRCAVTGARAPEIDESYYEVLEYSDDEPRDKEGRWTYGEGIDDTKSPSGDEGHFHSDKGGLVFHGADNGWQASSKQSELYTTTDYNEAHGFARGAHRMGSLSAKSVVMKLQAKPGKTLDVSDKMMEVLEGDKTEREVMQEARKAGARYATFDHPSHHGEKSDFKAIVSLYPKEDLTSLGGWKLKRGN
jgi:hypothetical protein